LLRDEGSDDDLTTTLAVTDFEMANVGLGDMVSGDLFFRVFVSSTSFFSLVSLSSITTVEVSFVNSPGDFPETKTVTRDVLGTGGSGSAVANGVWGP